VRAACELAYRRGYEQGAEHAAVVIRWGVYDAWRRAVGRWRSNFATRTNTAFKEPPQVEEFNGAWVADSVAANGRPQPERTGNTL